jgi:hypothetical protein
MQALQTVAINTPEIFALVEDRVYINEIPEDEIEKADTHHPPKILVIRQGGGGGKADRLVVVDRVIICNCYGETDYEAEQVQLAVEQRFTFLEREIVDDVLIHHINPTGGPLPNVEPDLVWPIVSQSYTVKANVLEVA